MTAIVPPVWLDNHSVERRLVPNPLDCQHQAIHRTTRR